MASIIDNRSKTMLDSLKNSLKQAESVDILTAFFYFSGFNALAEELKDKKIRILVGNTIDPNAVADLCNAVKECPDEMLETYAVRGYNRLNNSQKKNCYTDGKFSNLKYQLDAIKYGVDCINKNNGVIIADVVGLGKSVVASAIAYNLDIKRTVIIAPPHLVDQWNDYQQDFGLRGVRVCSSGRIQELYDAYSSDPNPILYIIDEAHRYRNELSDSYQLLHQLTRSHPENKVILLTATPYNNRPQDLFALIKLFQTPSRSTIHSVDNLGVRFHELIAQYNRLEKEGKKHLTAEIKAELDKLSQQLRILIDPVIVRRSRIDLQEIKEYADDLKAQNIQFPKIVGPELVEYDLADIRPLYLHTLDLLSNKFICARYNPSAYLVNPDAFMKQYGEFFGEMNIQLSQRNLAMFIKRLLVMRFESSKSAFKSTLTSILSSYENIIKWWDKGYVPIKKSGYLPDPDDEEIQETLDEIKSIDEIGVDINKIKKKAIPIEKSFFREEFICAVKSDIELLKGIYTNWFESDEIGIDPKYNVVKKRISTSLAENHQKIRSFRCYAFLRRRNRRLRFGFCKANDRNRIDIR